ncbi:hypothetical protein MAR_013045 [Mya arenaria]|uniref:Uncharacterized protein n=1 Tax=Mya arenaria TaxID=6604 RepID=A0ABY7G7U8_MYAAR|nr:uncharacterized protein LOC128220495 [Mya arenaria]WAR27341.1 hypothetical protein MAR_013045 [Mya arenaria]
MGSSARKPDTELTRTNQSRKKKQTIKKNGRRGILQKDKYGDVFYYDTEKDWFYYLDQNNVRYYKDEDGETFYLDEQERPYHLTSDGEKVYMDNKGIAQLETPGTDNKDGVDLNALSENDKTSENMPPSTASTAISFNIKPKLETPVLFNGVQITRNMPSLDSVPSIEILDHRNRWSTTESGNSDVFDVGTMSTYSSLSFVSSNFNREALITPNYINDESEEVEIQRVAQNEAENRILHKLLDQERNKPQLPPAKSYRKVGMFSVKIDSDKNDCIISGSAFLPDGQLVMSDYKNKKLKLFNRELQCVNAAEVGFSPIKLCSGKKDNLIHVAFKSPSTYGIKIFKVEKNEFQNTITTTTPWPIGGLGRSSNGLAVMQSKSEAWFVHLLNLKGKLLREIDLRKEGYKLSNSEYLVITEDLDIVVTDRGHNSVISFNHIGEEVFTYTQLREPMGLCTDGKGSIFVTSPGIVHQISKSGERIQSLMARDTIGLTPVNICYDTEDNLMVFAGNANTMSAFEVTDSQ